MASLEFAEHPELQGSVLIAAFAGWPDAGEGATRAVRYLIDQVGAHRLTSIDPEDFYNFSERRPMISTDSSGKRVIAWPPNDVYYWSASNEGTRDLVFLNGVEPHFRWKTYCSLLYEVVQECNVELVLTVGALLDAVPHTRPVTVTASATTRQLGRGFEDLQFGPSTYEGPTGITSVLTEYVSSRGVPCASLWGHAPHYVQASPNPTVTRALVTALEPFVPVEVNTSALVRQSRDFIQRVERALAGQDEVTRYVSQLEEKYDAEHNTGSSSAAGRGAEEDGGAEPLIAELEEYLRRQQSGDEGDTPGV